MSRGPPRVGLELAAQAPDVGLERVRLRGAAVAQDLGQHLGVGHRRARAHRQAAQHRGLGGGEARRLARAGVPGAPAQGVEPARGPRGAPRRGPARWLRSCARRRASSAAAGSASSSTSSAPASRTRAASSGLGRRASARQRHEPIHCTPAAGAEGGAERVEAAEQERRLHGRVRGAQRDPRPAPEPARQALAQGRLARVAPRRPGARGRHPRPGRVEGAVGVGARRVRQRVGGRRVEDVGPPHGASLATPSGTANSRHQSQTASCWVGSRPSGTA